MPQNNTSKKQSETIQHINHNICKHHSETHNKLNATTKRINRPETRGLTHAERGPIFLCRRPWAVLHKQIAFCPAQVVSTSIIVWAHTLPNQHTVDFNLLITIVCDWPVKP